MIIPESLQKATSRIMSWYRTQGGKRRGVRPVPDSVREKYHHAMWAVDLGGTAAGDDRRLLQQMFADAVFVAGTAGGPDGAKIAEDLLRQVNEACERAIQHYEKDRDRSETQKMTDFLVGTMRRVRRAAAMSDVSHLHFFSPRGEVFNAEMKHPQFQIGYTLWQGIVREMKDAISLVQFRDRPLPRKVRYLVDSMVSIIRAMEHADLDGFAHYDPRKSPLALSEEQQGRLLWEGVREEIQRVVAIHDAAA